MKNGIIRILTDAVMFYVALIFMIHLLVIVIKN